MNEKAQNWTTGIFVASTFALSLIRLVGVEFDDKAYQSIVFFLFSVSLGLIWSINVTQAKRVKSFAEEEKQRDRQEEKRQNKIFDILERLTQALVETFNGHEFSRKYYEFRITNAKDKVEDLTWAVFDREGKLDKTTNDYISKIQSVAESGTNYDEIFIFHKSGKNRIDRLKKLEFHYNNAKKNRKRKNSKYSCSYFDVQNLNFDFPRIQFTIIDNEEIIFTSGTYDNEKFKVRNKQLTKVFSNYYKEAWELSDKLIVNGEIVNENKILELLEPLDL